MGSSSFATTTSAIWNPVGPADFVNSKHIGYTSMAIDGKGVPYLAYTDADNNSALSVLRYDASSRQWILVGKAGFTDKVSYPDLAIDRVTNMPYVAYTGGTCNGIVVSSFDSSSQQWAAIPDPNDAVNCKTKDASNEKIGVASGGLDLIYRNPPIMNTNEIFYLPSRGWRLGPLSPSIETDHQQYTYSSQNNFIAFLDVTAQQPNVLINDQGWKQVGKDSLSYNVNGPISLAIDSNGSAYLAYITQDKSNDENDSLYVYKSVNPKNYSDVWIAVGDSRSPIAIGGTASALNIAIDNTNTPYVAYSINNKQLWVKKFDGTTWVDYGSPIAKDNFLLNPMMKSAANGSLFIAFTHCATTTSNCSITVMSNQAAQKK